MCQLQPCDRTQKRLCDLVCSGSVGNRTSKCTQMPICNVPCRAAGAKGTVLRSSSRHHPPATQAVVVSRGLAGINLPCARSQCTMTGQQLISNAHAHCCYMHARASLQFASRVELATRVVSVARVVADPPPIGAEAGAGIGAEAPPSWWGHHLSAGVGVTVGVPRASGVEVTVGVGAEGHGEACMWSTLHMPCTRLKL